MPEETFQETRDRETRDRKAAEKARAVTIGKRIVSGIAGLISLIIFLGCFYTVDEGHIGIVKRFSEAKEQVSPGLHFKWPMIEDVESIEVRTRNSVEEMASATKEQMPVSVRVSTNWTVNKADTLELFKKYGGLEQFEDRILNPRFRSATKDTIPKFNAEQLVQDRATAMNLIEVKLIEKMEDFPITLDNIQIENIQLPPKYLTSIETKQTEKNLAAAEKHKLEKQRLVALQAVNTADAEAQGILKVAEAEAKAIQLKGAAEATAIKAKAKALKNNPLLVQLTHEQQWNGSRALTIIGGGTMPIVNLPGAK